ncbi:hypothetical protein [Catenuloplanes atrovinosus]|uniref:Uncharacterized protein n=1 Tax=Catenuloplanes atrovinosus TaxID=137266 RepID=A0AAE4C7X4_9ACTN|nr:hypothetical protein [Catenuloplanes atrovinosus]MDR7274946.1 hypothetical protein [Catenuloplanes atrovinosus]
MFPPSPAEVRGPRPATVTVAVIMQYVVVALLVAMAGLVIWEGVSYGLLIDEAASTPGASQIDADMERVANWTANGVATSLLVLLAGWLLTNTLLTARGSNVARILAVAGLGVPLGLLALAFCGGGALGAFTVLGAATSDPFAGTPYEEDPFPVEPPSSGGYYHEDAFYARLTDLLAQRNLIVFDAGMPLFGAIAIFLAITVMVLLLVPSTNRWFNPGGAPRSGPRPLPQPWPPVPVHPYAPQPFVNQNQPFPAPPYATQQFPVPHFPVQPPVPPYPVQPPPYYAPPPGGNPPR